MYAFLILLSVVVCCTAGWGKISANFNGERLCAFCNKRMKYVPGTSHYAPVCPRCGRTQPRAAGE